MEQQEIEQAGRSIIAEVLNMPVEQVWDEANLEEDLGIDSIDVVEVIMAVETKFDITIEEGEADGIITVKDFLDALVEKINQC